MISYAHLKLWENHAKAYKLLRNRAKLLPGNARGQHAVSGRQAGAQPYPVVISTWVHHKLGARFTRLPGVSRVYHPIERVELSPTRLVSESLVASEHHL